MQDYCNKKWLKKEYLLPSLVYATTQIPFYKKWESESILNLYDKLPIIGKQNLLASYDEFNNKDKEATFCLYSSGYSTGNRTPIYRSKEESEFLKRYFSRVNDETSYLNIYLKYEPGGDYVKLTNNILIVDLLEEEVDISNIFRTLEKLNISRKLRLIGLEFLVRIFTQFYLDNKPSFEIAELVIGGDLITERRKNYYISSLHSKVINRFGMTELFGGALFCDECNLFHPDEFLLFDITKPVSNNSEGSFYGHLMLSSTYPFTQKIFLIKYLTGDYVKFCYCEDCDSWGFEFLGRTKTCLFDGDQLILSGAMAYNILDNFNEVARSMPLKNSEIKALRPLVGHLRFNVYLESNTVFANICIIDLQSYDDVQHIQLKEKLTFALSALLISPDYTVAVKLFEESSNIKSFMPDEIEV